jgi:hypothetical protein
MRKTRQQLLARHKELLDRLTAIRSDLGKGLSRDSEEQAVQLENLDVLQEIHRLASAELKAIELELSELSDED